MHFDDQKQNFKLFCSFLLEIEENSEKNHSKEYHSAHVQFSWFQSIRDKTTVNRYFHLIFKNNNQRTFYVKVYLLMIYAFI